MKILPSEKFVLGTGLSEQELLSRLHHSIGPKRIFTFEHFLSPSPSKPYQGHVEGNHFTMTRIPVFYRNSFMPVIHGTIERRGTFCLIKIDLKLNDLVKAFSVVWLSIVTLGALGAIAYMLMTFTFDPVMLIPFGMLCLFFLMVWFSFKLEASKDKQKLQELLQATLINTDQLAEGAGTSRPG